MSRHDEAWRTQARCQDADPDIFFPSDTDASVAAKAKAVCGACSVREQCLDYALTAGMEYGVWGGLGPKQRRLLARRTQRRAA